MSTSSAIVGYRLRKMTNSMFVTTSKVVLPRFRKFRKLFCQDFVRRTELLLANFKVKVRYFKGCIICCDICYFNRSFVHCGRAISITIGLYERTGHIYEANLPALTSCQALYVSEVHVSKNAKNRSHCCSHWSS